MGHDHPYIDNISIYGIIHLSTLHCISQSTHEVDALEKLRLDRQQWRLSAEVVGAETQDFTSTITGVNYNSVVDSCLYLLYRS